MSDTLQSPPRPRPSLRLAVTGHRPGASLPETAVMGIRAQIAALLASAAEAVSAVRDRNASVFSQEAPLLVALSALAEGSDRIFAEEALHAGWQLDAVLPFGRADYERDFTTAESRAAFADLVGRARAVFEIGDPRLERDRGAAYEAAGIVMLDYADLLIAIWDGGESAGRGGTREIIDEAVNRGIPVVWIRSNGGAPATWDGQAPTPLDLAAEDRGRGATLGALVSTVIAPPSTGRSGHESDSAARLLRFLCEGERRPVAWGRVYDAMLRFLTGKRIAAAIGIRERQDEWRGFLDALPPVGRLGDALGGVLLVRYLWADRTASELGRLYRSAYVLNFILAAVAVFVGLLTILDGWNELFGNVAEAKTVCVVLEFALILSIVTITLTGRHGAWHQRFLDARRLAEMLRHVRVLAPVGRLGRSSDACGPGADAGDRWTAWYARATSRELPVPNARADSEFLRRVVAAVLACEVAGQIEYHHTNYHVLEQVHHRLDRAGEALFYATGFLCLVWFAVIVVYGLEGADHRHWVSHTLKSILTFLGAVLPASAAALAGIRAQGDFGASAMHSLATELELRSMSERAEKRVPANYRGVCTLLEALTDTMISDLGTWRLMYRHRPLTVPG